MPERFSNKSGTADMHVGNHVIADRVSFDTRTQHFGEAAKWTCVDLPVHEVRLLVGHLRRVLAAYDGIEPVKAHHVTYLTRDLGYGRDTGSVLGTWGDYDEWGKCAFVPMRKALPTLYLFDDEVVEDVEVTL